MAWHLAQVLDSMAKLLSLLGNVVVRNGVGVDGVGENEAGVDGAVVDGVGADGLPLAGPDIYMWLRVTFCTDARTHFHVL